MSEKHFLSRRETHEWLRGIGSLDLKQRAAVEEAMIELAGSGGISKDELERKLLKSLREMRGHGTIGSSDYDALEDALKSLYSES